MAGLIFGGLYSTIVLTGLHHSFHAIEAGLLANKDIGVNFLLPIWSMANVAQGGATLAVYFKTKNKRTKEIAIPAAASAFLGITEPAIFGVNLKLGKPFIAAAIGGAIGGAYVVWMQVAANAYGFNRYSNAYNCCTAWHDECDSLCNRLRYCSYYCFCCHSHFI